MQKARNLKKIHHQKRHHFLAQFLIFHALACGVVCFQCYCTITPFLPCLKHLLARGGTISNCGSISISIFSKISFSISRSISILSLKNNQDQDQYQDQYFFQTQYQDQDQYSLQRCNRISKTGYATGTDTQQKLRYLPYLQAVT